MRVFTIPELVDQIQEIHEQMGRATGKELDRLVFRRIVLVCRLAAFFFCRLRLKPDARRLCKNAGV